MLRKHLATLHRVAARRAMSNSASDARQRWLDWSAKQARILTGGGVAESLYSTANNFSFTPSEDLAVPKVI